MQGIKTRMAYEFLFDTAFLGSCLKVVDIVGF